MVTYTISEEQSRASGSLRQEAIKARREYTALTPIDLKEGGIKIHAQSGSTFTPREDGRWDVTFWVNGKYLGKIVTPKNWVKSEAGAAQTGGL